MQPLKSSKSKSPLSWPKEVTELHVHLGGSVPLYRLWEIAIDRGIRGMGSGYDEFINILKIQDGRVKDLDSYLKVYDTIELIQSGPSAVRESIIIAIHRAFRTGGMRNSGPGGEGGSPQSLFSIRNLELRFNPLKRTGAVFLKGHHAGLYDVDRVIKAACDAVEEVEIGFKGQLKVGLIFCFGRDMTSEANRVLADKTAYWAKRSKKIVGVDLAGHESVNALDRPEQLEEMKEIFSRVPSDLGRTVHVGETPHVTLPTFLATIEALNPQRVAHPMVAFKAYLQERDERGLLCMKERKITCEFCVKSNLLTHAVSSLDEFREVLTLCDHYEIPYTFSTDAPSLQNTSLAEELMLLLEHGAASPEQILYALQCANDARFVRSPVEVSSQVSVEQMV
jgi:adenosine deaminase